jgi:enediyne core biosynthesis thioesterase
MAMRTYEYRHVVGFEETNLVGNVYYTNHLRWQGRCREMFLRDYAPGILRRLAEDFALVTVRCSCEYLAELRALDEVAVRMRLASMEQNRIAMDFEYWRIEGGREQLVARGNHVVACMRREADGGVTPVPIPDELGAALRSYQ